MVELDSPRVEPLCAEPLCAEALCAARAGYSAQNGPARHECADRRRAIGLTGAWVRPLRRLKELARGAPQRHLFVAITCCWITGFVLVGARREVPLATNAH